MPICHPLYFSAKWEAEFRVSNKVDDSRLIDYLFCEVGQRPHTLGTYIYQMYPMTALHVFKIRSLVVLLEDSPKLMRPESQWSGSGSGSVSFWASWIQIR